jgi:hypothetical protein
MEETKATYRFSMRARKVMNTSNGTKNMSKHMLKELKGRYILVTMWAPTLTVVGWWCKVEDMKDE